jgi:unsaturated chondroitin disaccharide hydrolase
MSIQFCRHLSLIVFAVASILACAQEKASDKFFIERQLRNALTEIQNSKVRSGSQNLIAPRSIRNDTLFLVPSKDWTSGFFAGNLWQTFELTGNAFWRSKAIEFTNLLEVEKNNDRTHDMGFKMFCSYGQAYRLTKEQKYKDILVTSARTLTMRFNPTVGCIRSWDHNRDKWKFPVIIDNMMNLELLFWAFKQTDDSIFYNVAVRHADTTMKNHFRGDYSSYHVVDYDTVDGSVRARQTHQGYKDESSWARGQAWALYGYTMCYRETGLKRYLEHAERVANFIFTHPHMPEDLVPYWDFDAPQDSTTPRDASAAAVMSSALLELSTFKTASAHNYNTWARQIVGSLASRYINTRYTELGFLLDHSTGHLPAHHEIDVPIIYADYYFLESLLRLKR